MENLTGNSKRRTISNDKICEGESCSNIFCEGLFCPRSTRWNFHNFGLKLTEVTQDLENRANRHMLLNLPIPNDVSADITKSFIDLSMAKVDLVVDKLFNNASSMSKSEKQGEYTKKPKWTTDEDERWNRLIRLEEREEQQGIKLKLSCFLCQSNVGESEGMISDCRHVGCFTCFAKLELLEIDVMDCFGCDRKQVRFIPYVEGQVQELSTKLEKQTFRDTALYFSCVVCGNELPLKNEPVIDMSDIDKRDFFSFDCKKHRCCWGCVDNVGDVSFCSFCK